ncbi:hypothetical protein RCJ22_17475 [Vibrio sp. FNV 38]|nr:hypothetical protein [Vibrio sp. FNV 38]
MNSVSAHTYQRQQTNAANSKPVMASQAVDSPDQGGTSAQPVTVSISSEARARSEQSPSNIGNKHDNNGTMESFAYGALGMDHPDVVKEQDDPSYTAGQYVSAAATIGGILLMLA